MAKEGRIVEELGAGAFALGAGCLGALLTVVVLTVHRSSSAVIAAGLGAWKPAEVGAFLGFLALGGGLVLLFLRDRYRVEAGARARAGGMAIAVSGVVAVAIGWLALMPTVAGGVLVSVGSGLLLFPWLCRFSTFPIDRCFAAVGIAFAVAAALVFMISLMAVPLMGWAVVACAAVAAAGLWMPVQPGRHGGEAPSPQAESVQASRRLAAFWRRAWRPVVGAFITVFVFGFTWDTDLVGVVINDSDLLASEKIVGMVLGAAAFLALSRMARRGRDAQRVLFNMVLPFMVVVFVVRPYFLSMSFGPLALALIGVLRETGFALFLGAAWIALASASRASDVSPGFAAGVLLAGAGACGLAGLGALYGLGSVSSYMGAILFTVYLVVIVVAKSSGAALAEERGGAPEPQDLESVIATRCAALADEWNLTPRERDIMGYLARGHSYPYIAGQLVISENTVRTHVRNVYKKARITSREELLARIHESADF